MPKAIQPFNPSDTDGVAVIAATAVPQETYGRSWWHVFSDGIDEYYSPAEEARANERFKQLGDQFGCARLYFEVEDAYGNTDQEECVEAIGDYPM